MTNAKQRAEEWLFIQATTNRRTGAKKVITDLLAEIEQLASENAKTPCEYIRQKALA